jgi:hypothetical protein
MFRPWVRYRVTDRTTVGIPITGGLIGTLGWLIIGASVLFFVFAR